jgi:hypothetical protein
MKDIKIHETTYQKLVEIGGYQDTMDSIVVRILEVAKKNDKEGELARKS